MITYEKRKRRIQKKKKGWYQILSAELNPEELHPSLSHFKVRFSENQFFWFFLLFNFRIKGISGMHGKVFACTFFRHQLKAPQWNKVRDCLTTHLKCSVLAWFLSLPSWELPSWAGSLTISWYMFPEGKEVSGFLLLLLLLLFYLFIYFVVVVVFFFYAALI